MKNFYLICVLICLVFSSVKAQDVNFNKSWKFLNKNVKGAEQPLFDDSGWRTLNLPHDWVIENSFDVKKNGANGNFSYKGIGWYRKKIKVKPENQGKVVRIEFEGAMCNAQVWINGQLVGSRPNGYIGFELDISQYLKYDDTENIIAVRLNPDELSFRGYSGAGLYRSVWLRVDEPIYIDIWGTYFKTSTINQDFAIVQNETTIINKKGSKVNIEVRHEYISPTGQSVAIEREIVTVPANSRGVSATYTKINKPQKWDIDTPNIYNVITTLHEGGVKIDTFLTRIGLRTLTYTNDGFYINNQNIRFKGVCLRHDNGSLGTAVYRKADERKLRLMKEMGANAVKVSHNPPSREFLELCDEIGLMVIDEFFDVWQKSNTTNGYDRYFEDWSERDLKDIITRDRNHPSIVMWSLGDGILEQSSRKNGYKIAKRLHDLCVEMDPSRPTTMGLDNYKSTYAFNFAQQVQIPGINYKPSEYQAIRKMFSQLPLYGSKTSGYASSRGVYHLPIKNYNTHKSQHVTSYDVAGPIGTYPPDVEFYFQEKNTDLLGAFVYTGFDYLKPQTTITTEDNANDNNWNKNWPSRASYFGAVDLCGFPKDRFYLYQSQWTEAPMIHLLPHWNWKGNEGKKIPVYCYTNCDEAELFVNGVSMGSKVKGKDVTEIPVDFLNDESKTFKSKYRLSWEVPYRAGNIKVVGYKNGEVVKEEQIFTAGKPSKTTLTADNKILTADGNDLVYIAIEIKDTKGNLCPNADNLIKFSVKGEGVLVAVDNGNQISNESFQKPQIKAFNGKCVLIIKSTEKKGKIEVTAKSKSLKSSKIVIYSK
ncbi:glycoside hydrolase family 2 TIM barrel-domain containing protein [Wenyingzhuangia sp. IMCC45533]